MFLQAVAIAAAVGSAQAQTPLQAPVAAALPVPVAAVAPAGGFAADTDTTFDVPASGRMKLEMLSGTVRITTWDRNTMRVRARHGSGTEVEIDRRGGNVSIETVARRGQQNVDFELSVPRRYAVDIEGVNVRVSVDGVRATVKVENVEGAIMVANVLGNVDVESVSGDITVNAVRGNVSVSTTNNTIRLDDIRGNVDAETVNGSIVMRRIDALRVEASTVQGLVEYEGTFRDGGRYYMGTHNGRITLRVPDQTNARVAVSTYNGKVETAFPVQVNRLGSGEYSLTLGSGSARVELESFNGSVYLMRPGSR